MYILYIYVYIKECNHMVKSLNRFEHTSWSISQVPHPKFALEIVTIFKWQRGMQWGCVGRYDGYYSWYI